MKATKENLKQTINMLVITKKITKEEAKEIVLFHLISMKRALDNEQPKDYALKNINKSIELIDSL